MTLRYIDAGFSRGNLRLKISVITAAFNSAGSIRQSLDSFFEQDWPNKELILVDGASEDKTLEIAQSYPQDQMVILSEPDQGMYDALNKGLRLYTGDAFGVLNSDDRFHDAQSMTRIAQALGTYDMVHGHVNYIRDHDSKALIRAWRAEPRPPRGFASGWMPCHTSFFVRREVQEAVGDFCVDYKISADYDWMIRAIDLGDWTLETLDEVQIDMMVGGMSTNGLGAYIEHNLQSLRIRQKLLGSRVIDYALFAKPLRKIGQFIRASRS